jgi:putative PIN family toxin of toxin-antitoxin system
LILVIDSGVWISALQFKGTPLLAVEQSLVRHQIAVCEPILREMRAALLWKFGWTDDEVEEVFAFYLSRATHVKVSGKFRDICRDPKDDMVFECAALAGASIIVAGDKDILVVKTYQKIRVLTPREFLELPESKIP